MKSGLYLGYPGIGKTPMAKEERNVIDLDAGLVRKALAEVAGLSESDVDECELARFMAVLAREYIKEGWAVVTNLPLVMEYATVARMYVPSTARGYRSAAEKLHIDPSNVQTYVEEWTLAAKSHDVPVVKLRRGIDYIFRSHRLNSQRVDTASDEDENRDDRKMGEFWN